MDDFIASSLEESKNEWCIRLYNALTPHIIDGLRSIFKEAWSLCLDTKEPQKYLMTFQNLLSRIPQWNANIIDDEKRRILEKSGCSYLEDLITCVHIIQLKCLTCIRVGHKHKKIDISIPKLDVFIHKVYILVARYIYSHVYLFEQQESQLQYQKNQRELELCIRECIMNAVRESVPTEQIILAYLDESVEEEEEIRIEPITLTNENTIDDSTLPPPSETRPPPPPSSETRPPPEPSQIPSIQNLDDNPVITQSIKFNDFDTVFSAEDHTQSIVSAPKTVERLEEISSRSLQRKLDELNNNNDDDASAIRILEPVDIDIQPMNGGFNFIDL
jgi:hypothetical protein